MKNTMKKTIAIVCAAMILVFSLSLAGCGKKDSIEGKYKLNKVSVSTGESATIHMAKTGSIELKSDKTFAMTYHISDNNIGVHDQNTKGTYTIDGETLTLKCEAQSNGSERTIEGTVKSGTIKLTDSFLELTYKK